MPETIPSSICPNCAKRPAGTVEDPDSPYCAVCDTELRAALPASDPNHRPKLSRRDRAALDHRLRSFAEIVEHASSAIGAARELKDHDLVAGLTRSARQAMTSLETEALKGGDAVVEDWGLEVARLHELLGL